MNGKGSLTLEAGIEKAWDVLLDPNVLEKCIMGCKKMEQESENKYNADLSIGIAAVKGKYESTIEIADIEKPSHYKLIVKGEGGPGNVEAAGIIDLTPIDENTTELAYTYEADVGGKVAMIGQRMLGGVAKLIIQDFFKKLGKELKRIESNA
ncbi:carbon monoxide dehydrogenase [Peribacillus cavernae]|uniref:Carbon monoxide dehydrogenase n=1 Tax=Peribacillus cavernae TaxID=1674310 RepID=A0A3S0W1W9_9BACI|nr:carbon monoxide dehydrogenase subunit G [Peribacillus cavernae]MDQ0218705.1 carbon monoxide dehydrogenase subunit G [Peribacillus cavernae]RUQ30922.1 carbon monoxide dehydrogenase [Peribacillus cavernae]